MKNRRLPWKKPRYLVEDTDRHGNVRLYVRRPGHRKIRIFSPPQLPSFWDEYSAALKGVAASDPRKPARRAMLWQEHCGLSVRITFGQLPMDGCTGLLKSCAGEYSKHALRSCGTRCVHNHG